MAVEYKNLEECSLHLNNGGLVAFPTETVYGLGANALDESAVNDIFKMKERPKTDPIIIHIHSFDQIYNLIDVSFEDLSVLRKISDKFWPGPLTVLVKSSKNIPKNVTADSPYVGIRIPANDTALSLLKESNIPIAAPSANKFEHISPTNSIHVERDFKNNHNLNNPLYILSENNEKSKIGIESTILKLDFESNKFTILRPGYITFDEIQDLFSEGKYKIDINISYKNKNDNMDSSGQSIKHYSTNCPTTLLEITKLISLEDLPINKNIAIIDIANKCYHLRNNLDYYDNISLDNSVDSLMFNFYCVLRKFESYNEDENIKMLYLVSLSDVEIKVEEFNKYQSLYDRMYRSASGNFFKI